MIRRKLATPRMVYGPNGRQLAWSAFKGAGMGALLTLVLVKLVG